ncbi:hypothetical protein F5Y05DRAFT_64909 [Hypoxylon sp. FL0543]|nr:hypothetical protein F5Y05DRAFT_64909 [Hypoxylon sp. FL0543]
MAKRTTTKVPDAWDDDDWEVQADRAVAEEEPEPQPQPQPQLSRAERLAQHAESNRKLWESAEAPPDPFHYLAARPEPPLATTFKPAVKVLSRKPAQDSSAPDDDDAEGKKTPQLTPEEILAKQQREREEKQRRYDEARAKIFGTGTGMGGSNPSSGTSTPGAVTPPRSADGRGPRGRGRGRGGGGGARHNESRGERDRDSNQRPGSQSGGRELYDPNYSPKPGFQLERRGNNYNNDGGAPLSRRSTPREEDQVIRAPRGPDGSGRGGFGFAKRGAKGS